MSGGVIIAILIVLVILAVAATLARRIAIRGSGERRKLGPDYRRLVDKVGTSKANAEYHKRRRRVDALDIQPLSPEKRTLYGIQWVAAQETFVSNPAQAARTAAQLVAAVAAERGYHVADSSELLDDLSVYYGDQLDGYRSALAATKDAGPTATEQLRQAMLDYRAMFCELAEISDSDELAAATATTEADGSRAQGRGAAAETTAGSIRKDSNHGIAPP